MSSKGDPVREEIWPGDIGGWAVWQEKQRQQQQQKIQKKLLVSCETSEHTEERVNSVTILLRYTDPSTRF